MTVIDESDDDGDPPGDCAAASRESNDILACKLDCKGLVKSKEIFVISCY